MSRIIDNEKKSLKSIWFLFIIISTGIVFYYYKNKIVVPPNHSAPLTASFKSNLFSINKGAAINNKLQTYFLSFSFSQNPKTIGISSDETSVQFDNTVDIKGIAVSYSCDSQFTQVKLTASLHEKPAYPNNQTQDVLTYSGCIAKNEPQSVNQTFWYQTPIRLEAGEKLNWGSFLENNDNQTAHLNTQVLIYYTWVETQVPQPTWHPRVRYRTPTTFPLDGGDN